jgi:hypothetical protein
VKRKRFTEEQIALPPRPCGRARLGSALGRAERRQRNDLRSEPAWSAAIFALDPPLSPEEGHRRMGVAPHHGDRDRWPPPACPALRLGHDESCAEACAD